MKRKEPGCKDHLLKKQKLRIVLAAKLDDISNGKIIKFHKYSKFSKPGFLKF